MCNEGVGWKMRKEGRAGRGDGRDGGDGGDGETGDTGKNVTLVHAEI